VLAVLVIVLLVAGAVGSLSYDDDLPDWTAPLTRQEAARVVRQLERFVERERGLRFKRRPKVEFLDDAAFRKRLLGEEKPTADDRRRAEEQEGVLRALGLLDDDVDLIESTEEALGAGVVGFYRYDTKSLAVRGRTLNAYTRATLAHELTHALDDQHFGLRRPELEDDSEAEGAFEALTEGNAERIRFSYVGSLPAGLRDDATRPPEGTGLSSDIPFVVYEGLAFPYRMGPPFVAAVVRDGDERAVNHAFEDPPTTTEQIVFPATYFEHDRAKPVALPKADGPKLYDDVIGAWWLYLVLRQRVDDTEAMVAAKGWGGDKFVAWKEGDQTCVRVNFVMDTPEDLAELRDALEAWSEDGNASVTGDDPLVLTSCG
jgi:hypothetical protein